MAAIDWPYALATIEWSGYERGADSDVERTPFEDGSVRQATLVSRSYELRRFTVAVKLSDHQAFEDWLRVNSNTTFNFRDFSDKVIKDVRLRGGRGTVTLRAVGGDERLDGEFFSRGTVELEGYW